ncbi:hypothetical protein FBD94_21235 [Pedobacter hiemivivus]|uniref:RES domain-containing protein n=1 Tax=Pedobacter hiemivivus TaxID=2530454 RepID=A0A4U1G102_9SPHI|nr:hypothetical protein [Pedobacter hiemivivus]TKC57157.1 hypothetical protein FBD94_21235 [Pedobacter hiemivivus]
MEAFEPKSSFYDASELNLLPEYSVYKRGLNELFQIDFSTLSIQDLGHRIMDKLVLLHNLYRKFDINELANTKFYRVRSNIQDKDLHKLSSYSYPKAGLCAKNQRANLSNTTVFYCGDAAWGAILESRPSINSILYLSIWNVKPHRELKASICLSREMSLNNPLNFMAKEIHKFTEEHLKIYNNDKVEQLKLMHEFIPVLINNDKPPYYLSSWLCYQILNENECDFLIYPSSVNEEYNNFAVNPEVVDAFFELEKIIKFKVTGDGVGSVKLRNGNIGEVVNNRVVYRPYDNSDDNFIDSILK